MSDYAISVFVLTNPRGLLAPLFHLSYLEADTGNDWTISCGGTRGYLIRKGALAKHQNEQAPDSHFIIRRVTTAYLLGGAGLFEARVAGRLFIADAQDNLDIGHEMQGRWDSAQEDASRSTEWFGVLSKHTFVRRAADDAYLALLHPQEAFVFLYRGFEWIMTGLRLTPADLASELGVSKAHLEEMKKMANYETGVRHASKSGLKMRADFEVYATWTAGLVEAINIAAARVERGFRAMSAEEIARAVARGSTVAYE